MIKADIIVCWPRNCDYPLWRQFIRENRTRFNLVIIVFTETHFGEDYRSFVRESMTKDYVLFIEGQQPTTKYDDWRDLAIHQALLHSYNAPWIWFTEQDFILKDGFWDAVETGEKMGAEVLATYDVNRMHPCNIFINRDTLMQKTRRRFGIVVDVSDHFSILQKELESNAATIFKFPENTYEHLNGLSHNLTLLYRGEEPVWQIERFKQYLKSSLETTVEQDARYVSLVAAYLTKQLGENV